MAPRSCLYYCTVPVHVDMEGLRHALQFMLATDLREMASLLTMSDISDDVKKTEISVSADGDFGEMKKNWRIDRCVNICTGFISSAIGARVGLKYRASTIVV